MRLLFQSDSADPQVWKAAFQRLIPEIDFRIWPQVGDPAEIDMMLVWRPPAEGLGAFTNLRLLHLISAGSDQLNGYPLPQRLPVERLIEPGQIAGMIEYVTGAVLMHHRGFDLYARQKTQRIWHEHPRVPAARRPVGILGLGALGAPVAQALKAFGFPVHGWSRSGRLVEGITVHAGAERLPGFLAETEIVIGLLPLSPETLGFYDDRFFGLMRPGSHFINVGRGSQLEMQALGRALQSGHLAGATLDVLPKEPPEPDDPVWAMPNLTLTPHVATSPDPITAAQTVLANWHRVIGG